MEHEVTLPRSIQHGRPKGANLRLVVGWKNDFELLFLKSVTSVIVALVAQLVRA